jgi:hypothetical protein
MSAKFAPGLREKLAANRSAQVNLILRVKGDVAVCRTRIEQAGFHVKRTFRIVPGFAVKGSAAAALALADSAWIIQIEPDRPVHTTTR